MSRFLTRAAVVGAAAWIGGISCAIAQETIAPKSTEPPPPPGWTISCVAASAQETLQCRMSQELFAAGAQTRVLAVSVARSVSGEGYDLTFALPHGVYLPDGISLKIDDGEPIKVLIESSNASGIFATLPLDVDLAAATRRGKTMLVGITNMSRKPLQIPVNLNGFTAAFTRMQGLK